MRSAVHSLSIVLSLLVHRLGNRQVTGMDQLQWLTFLGKCSLSSVLNSVLIRLLLMEGASEI